MGDLKRVKYLLTSPDLKEHADIHYSNELSLMDACSYGHIEIVKYLLTSPDLKEHANIYANGSMGVMLAGIYNQLNIIEYLIFDYKIEKRQEIEDYITKCNKKDLVKMFNKRELENKLQIIMAPHDKIITNKIKI